MKLTTSTAAAVVIAILFIAFGARANSDQDADPVMSVLIEPVAQVLPQEPLAQTPPQPPIEAEPEPEPSFWGWLWASFKKNHETIGTLSISIGGFIGIALALWRAIVATKDARTRDRDARTNSANAVTTTLLRESGGKVSEFHTQY